MKHLFLKYLLKDCLVNIEKNDVMHGYKYQNKSFDNTDVSLCLFSDAAPIYNSSKISLSVIFSSILELPQRAREAKQNIIVHSLIVGKTIERS